MVQLSKFVRAGLRRYRGQAATNRLSAKYAEGSEAIRGAGAFSRLHPYSLALTSTGIDNSLPRYLNLVLPELHENGIFAGIKTAVEFAATLAAQHTVGLRLLSISNDPPTDARARLATYVRAEFGFEGQLEILGGASLVGAQLALNDLWLATHWTTAHSLDIACRLKVVDASSVTYLIQDYEPGFYPWSTDYALARSTYAAGFRPVINSEPLRQFLQSSESVSVEEQFVFGPSLDFDGARRAASLRTRAQAIRILFYGRPSKPRNLFDIGVATLALVAEDLRGRGIEATFVSAGESHPDFALTSRDTLKSRGKLPWNDYFDLLGSSDIVLSLQHSPHPSHPPLDAVTSGAFAITNEMGGTRAGLHSRYLVSQPEPRALANQVLDAVDRILSGEIGTFDDHFAALFGQSIRAAVAAVSADISAVDSKNLPKEKA